MKSFWKGKKVLITGAGGFIGSHLVEELIKKDVILTIAVTDKRKAKKKLKAVLDKIVVKRANLLNVNEFIEVSRDQNVIFHLAGMDGNSLFKQKNQKYIFDTNTKIINNLFESSIRNNVKRILLVSSMEASHKENITKKNYAHSKLYAEILAKKYKNTYGINVAIARPCNVYGPGDYLDHKKAKVIPSFITSSIHNKDISIWGKGNEKLVFIYVKDLIKVLIYITEKRADCKPVNILGLEKISLIDLAKLIIYLTKSKSKVVHKNLKKAVDKKRTKILTKKNIIKKNDYTLLEKGLKSTIDYIKKQT